MPRNREHFELPHWQEPLPRRKPSAGGRPPERDRRTHGQQLMQQVGQVVRHLSLSSQQAPKGINPKLVFKLQLNRRGSLTEVQLRQLGLRVLARDSKRAIVVFPDEATLASLQRHVGGYAGAGSQYSYLASIDALLNITPEDRKGPKLKANPLTPEEIALLDVELLHGGDREEFFQRQQEVADLLQAQEGGLSVTDWWVGESLALLRVRVDASALELLLNIDYILEIDRRPSPSFEMADVTQLSLDQITITPSSVDDLVGVLVIDSGVMQGHPLLGSVLRKAEVFPDTLREFVAGGPEDGDERTDGHGTAVAGIAVYNDVGDCLASRTFTASASLFSARITNDSNEYDEDELVEHQLEEAIDYFLTEYPSVKVVNISLGDEYLVCQNDTSYQFRFAAAIDELAYQYREHEVVFIVSVGNFSPDLTGEEIRQQYPLYLLDTDEAHVIDPGTSALALTVGGLSYGAGRNRLGYGDDRTHTLIAGEQTFPAPFTRTGWGFGGAVKPEVVDFAGDQRLEDGRIPKQYASYAGLPTTAKKFAPPNGTLFRTVAGTSFAAPRVANLAARLFREFPDASSNLIRALIADSARVPGERPSYFADKESGDDEVLKVYGYGQPDFERARWSDSNEVVFLADGTMPIDSFQIFEIPPLPSDFFSTKGNGYISVTLAFDPPTRHTRADSYLGVGMQFDLLRNVAPSAVAHALRAWNSEEKEDLDNDQDLPNLRDLRRPGDPPVNLTIKPGANRRKKGTLQKGIVRISRSNWNYDQGPLVLAITCRRSRWLGAEVTTQRFAIVASLYHDDSSVDLYSHVQQHARIHQRVRIKV